MTSSPPKRREVKSCLAAALDYARRGWPVIPLHAPTADGCSCHSSSCGSVGKHPRTAHGLKDATTDEGVIHHWWGMWPDANVGVVTGAGAGLVVLDVDPRHGGDESLRVLGEQHGRLPQTATSRTGGGGHHLLFAHPGGRIRNKVNLAAGLDIRADGGYIVAPPSLHASGQRYEWDEDPDDSLSPPPQWLLALIEGGTKKPEPSSGQRSNGRLHAELIEAVIPEGARNASLASIAGTVRRVGWGEDIIGLFLQTVNEARCDPPLPSEEVAAIAKSVSRYPPEFPLETGVVAGHQAPGIPQTTNNSGSLMVGSQVDYKVNAKELRDEATAAGAVNLPYLPLLGQDGFLVEGWTHLIAGYPKVGKTQLMVQLCMSWSPRLVLYITEEPRHLWGYRLAKMDAWEQGTILPGLGAPIEQLLGEIRGGEEEIVVIDTVRLLGLKDENDNSALAAQLFPIIAACREGGKTLILLHHTRKGGGEHGEGIAGGHAFLGVVDIGIEIRRDKRQNRRLIKAYGRAGTGGEFLYEMREDGLMVPFGKPADVGLKEVKRKALQVLTTTAWLTTKEVLEAMPRPHPSSEQLRLALMELADDGSVERDPPAGVAAKGKTLRWRAIVLGPTDEEALASL